MVDHVTRNGVGTNSKASKRGIINGRYRGAECKRINHVISLLRAVACIVREDRQNAQKYVVTLFHSLPPKNAADISPKPDPGPPLPFQYPTPCFQKFAGLAALDMGLCVCVLGGPNGLLNPLSGNGLLGCGFGWSGSGWAGSSVE